MIQDVTADTLHSTSGLYDGSNLGRTAGAERIQEADGRSPDSDLAERRQNESGGEKKTPAEATLGTAIRGLRVKLAPDEQNEMVVKLIDPNTGEEVRQIPEEELRRIGKSTSQESGLLVDTLA